LDCDGSWAGGGEEGALVGRRELDRTDAASDEESVAIIVVVLEG
jgi:hypothetical protein